MPFNSKWLHGKNTLNLRDIYSNLSRRVYADNNHIDLSIFNDAEALCYAIRRLYNDAVFNDHIDPEELKYYFMG